MQEKPRKSSVTAEQIAKKVGLSNATVSRILNNTQYVSPAAREAVMSAIREVGETPRLLGRRTKLKPAASEYVEILMVNRFPPNSMTSPNQQQTSSSRLIEGIIGELRNAGLRGVVQMTGNLRDPKLLATINTPENRGVFLTGIYDEDVHPFLEQCRCPVVSFMTWQHNGWPDYIGIDNLTGIQLGFDHLRKLGHSKIGYVAGQLQYSHVFRQRLAAYKMLMADADLPWRRDWISEGSCDLEPMHASITEMLRSPDRPTAILCAFAGAALATRRAADTLQLQVPRDLSVVGFDDDEIAQLFSPPLTTVRVPVDLMGRHAVHIMTIRQQHPIAAGEGVSLRVTPTLIVRKSTAEPCSGA